MNEQFSYDDLRGTFFMLHGWVNDRIQTWLDAHGFETIGSGSGCTVQTKCYAWLSDPAYGIKFNDTPWEGVAPGPERNGAALHTHTVPTGPVPGLSVKARARLYKTRRMGGF